MFLFWNKLSITFPIIRTTDICFYILDFIP
jgi:hypothetical protein